MKWSWVPVVLAACTSSGPSRSVTYVADIQIEIPATLTIDGEAIASGQRLTFEFPTLDDLFAWTAHAVATTDTDSLDVVMKASNEGLRCGFPDPVREIDDHWELTDHTQTQDGGVYFYAASGEARSGQRDCGWSP